MWQKLKVKCIIKNEYVYTGLIFSILIMSIAMLNAIVVCVSLFIDILMLKLCLCVLFMQYLYWV